MKAYKKYKLDIMGIVEIPIKLYNAVDKQQISLSGMSKCCGSFVGYKTICKSCGKELTREEIGKGFWDGAVLTSVDKEMLEQIKLKTTENIEIVGFIDRDKIDSVLYSGKVYFIGIDEKKDSRTKVVVPNWVARKDYLMLKEALKRSKKVAIGKVVLTHKEEIVAISEWNDILIANVLYFKEQIRDYEELKFDGVELEKEDIEDSVALVNAMNKVELEKFKDRYIGQLKKIIAGEKIEVKKEKRVEVKNGNKWKLAYFNLSKMESK